MTKYSLFFFIAVTLGFICQTCRQKDAQAVGVYEINLSEKWQFRQAGKKEWLSAQVPGCVHTDLLRNKKIDDPFVSTHERKLNWIEREDWEYQTVFFADNKTLKKDQVVLLFEGLDTFASVYLNDSLILQAQNMFLAYEIPCKTLLKTGKNTIRIYFKSTISNVMPEVAKLGYKLPAPNDYSILKSYPFTRKAAFQYGSEFSPRFLTCGIWQPIRLIGYNSVKIKDLHIIQQSVSDEKAVLEGVFEVKSEKPVQAGFLLKSAEKLFPEVRKEVLLTTGTNVISINFEIPKPKRWWTNGLGKAFLYKILGEVKIADKTADTLHRKIGIRTLEVINQKDANGENFKFKLNGTEIFIKGANYLPVSAFVSEVSNEKYKKLFQSVKAANMNMLRVRGDGVYEKDVFYDLCDENGILVWQDFMFANALYPGDSNFTTNVEQEAGYQVKRLRNHPSLAIWCGNDEIETNWYQNHWKANQITLFQDSVQMQKDYRSLFYKMLPEIVRKNDNRFYLPTSTKFYYQDANSLKNNVLQFSQLFREEKPIQAYSLYTGRFVGKYQFFSFPELNTVWYYLPEPEDWERNSLAIKWHNRLTGGNDLLKNYIGQSYKIPNNFENYFYVSQLLQAEVVKATVEAHRRKKPYCMGTLYGLLQDGWTGVTPAGIDYFGNEKAMFFALKKAYNPVLVSPIEEDGKLKVYVVSDYLQALNGVLQVRLWDFSGREWFEESLNIRIPANSSGVYFSSDKWRNFLRGKVLNQLVLETTLSVNNEVVAENLHYLLAPKFLNLPVYKPDYQIVEKDSGFEITISASRLAKNVYLRCRKIRGRYSNNFFDILPDRKKTVFFQPETKMTLEDFKKELKISSLSDAK